MPFNDKPVTYQKTTAAEEKQYQNLWDRYKKEMADKQSALADVRWYQRYIALRTPVDEKPEQSIFDGVSTFFSPNSDAREPLLQPSEEVDRRNVWYPEKIRKK